MAMGFVRIATTTGIDRETAPLFWSTLVRVVFTNFSAAEMVIGLAAMHTNYEYQSRSYIKALRREIEYVNEIGEAKYNAEMLGTKPTVPAVTESRPN